MANTGVSHNGAGRKPAEAKPKSSRPRSVRIQRQDDPRAVVVIGCLQFGRGEAIDGSAVQEIRKSLKPVSLPEKKHVVLDLWLDSPGGSARDAYKIALIFRSLADHIRVVIPDYAKSAATLLSLVADEIFMAPSAELGPLDAQMDYELLPGMKVSALDRTRNLSEITSAVEDIILGLGGQVRRATNLGTADTLSVMADLASNLLQPLVAQIDPTILHRSNRILQEAVDYGKRLMLTRNDCSSELARRLPDRLTKDFPTHGYAISIEEAGELGLPVRPMHEYEYAEHVMDFYDENQARRNSVVGLIRVIEPPSHRPDEEPNDPKRPESAPTNSSGPTSVAERTDK